MSTGDIIIDRDLDNDVLYVTKRGTDLANTLNLNVDADTVMRLDRSTYKVVGFTIESFSKVMAPLKDLPNYKLMETFDHFIEIIDARGQLVFK